MRFPGESEEYRAARDELLAQEIALREQIARVAEQRSRLPLGGEVQEEYRFEQLDPSTGAPAPVSLPALFGTHDALLIYSFMWVPESQGLPFVGPCPSCTSIIDAVDGQVPHVEQRLGFAVATKAPIEAFREHAERRGWRHARLLSSLPSTYNRDYGAEDEDGNQWPLATVFVRRNGRIHHFWTSELWSAPRAEDQGPRHVDFMWPMWGIFDRSPAGRGDFQPSLQYGERQA
jgi:predicted dithiol-disulfide oxidoreductase (DUF899 family)